ncbi:MAG TPA: ABC transporter permease [Longimicrobiales bacterium]
METLFSDLRYAVRTLVKSPGFTLAAMLTLALGIGANTAVFSVVNGVLLRPLPYPEPDRLVYLGWEWNSGGVNSTVTAYTYEYIREHARVFDGVSTERGWATELGEGAVPDEVRGLRATADFFRVNGIAPALGRAFLPEEDRPGAPPVVVLSDGVWRTRFDADPAVLGRTVRLGGVPHAVVGVMPPGFRFPEAPGYTDFVVPFRLDPDPRDKGQNYQVRARLRPGVTLEQARADLAAVSARFREEHPELMGESEVGVAILGYQDIFVGGLERTLWILLGAVGFVLLIACVNVANLMLARATSRQREMAVRAAIGAGRGRIVRQLLTESVLLALGAAALGLVVGEWSVDGLLALAPSGLPRMEEIGLDGRVLGFTLAVALATGIAFGLTAAAHAFRVDLSGALRGGARRTGERSRRRVRSLFAASEAALAVVLLTGAGLLITSFFELRSVSAGFEPEGVLAVEFRRTPAEYGTAARVWQFERQVLERIRAIPGVVSAAATSTLPLQGQYNFPMTVVGRPDATFGAVQWRGITPGYFETLRIPLVRGRAFTARDDDRMPPVVIVNETFARKYFPGQNPIGQRIDIGTYQGKELIPGFDDPPREIVGVVGDVHGLGLDRAPSETMYIPRAQAPDGWAVAALGAIAVRVQGGAVVGPAVLDAIRALEPRMPLPRFRSMPEVIGASVAQERFNAVLLGLFAGLALVLTAIGIYGIVSYTVRQRTGEIGIRMALGARRDEVVRLFVRQGMVPVAIGLGIGIVAAFALTRLIESLLYGVSPTDPVTFAAVPIALAAVAAFATYLPARRAATVDPMVVLREE